MIFDSTLLTLAFVLSMLPCFLPALEIKCSPNIGSIYLHKPLLGYMEPSLRLQGQTTTRWASRSSPRSTVQMAPMAASWTRCPSKNTSNYLPTYLPTYIFMCMYVYLFIHIYANKPSGTTI